MSSAYLIALGAPGHIDPTQNTKCHEQLLDDLNAEAERLRWDGTSIDFYRRHEGYVSIYVTPGDKPATLEDLRLFRQAQRVAEAAVQDQPKQGSLL
jgi:hypothetical protein